jgi:signal recognition particle GTPase
MLTALQHRTFVKSLEDRKEEQDKKAFQDDIKYFLSKDTFTVHDFHERVLHGLKQKSTFKLMVWGEDAEVKVLEGQNKICSAMYDDEKNDPKAKLSADKKREIAETTQMQVSDVQDVLQKYYQL